MVTRRRLFIALIPLLAAGDWPGPSADFTGRSLGAFRAESDGLGTTDAPGGEAGTSDDEELLLALHARAIRAHQEGSIDLLLEDEAEDYVLVSRGEVSRPTLADRRRMLGPYLQSATFQEYRDIETPVVKVSADGQLGWVIATVRVRGSRALPEGGIRVLDFTSAWIELYEKRDGRWLRTGNVSNFKDP